MPKSNYLALGCYGLCWLLVLAALLTAGHASGQQSAVRADTLPPQPAEADWHFVRELQQPYHTTAHWAPRKANPDEAACATGITLEKRFPDPRQRLDTAYEDLNDFMAATGIKQGGPFKIITEQISTAVPETYSVIVTPGECRIQAGDSEGIRRGIFYVEDRILSARGPFLPLGALTRTPVIRTRISRCFFGPIKRLPKLRDELMDDVNYYPDQYLNRLAHEGINGLWLTIEFKDLCRTQAVPEYGHEAEPRLRKLRDTVRRCLRYGIKIYVFCIEPINFPSDSPVLAAHPELGGHRNGKTVYFCPSGKAGQDYLEESTKSIFSAVPDLGGLIDINVGERATICPNAGMKNNNCPRCSKRQPWEIMADCLGAMERGMHAANPNAELISWFYCPNAGHESGWSDGWSNEALRTVAGKIPPGVALQHNFESAGGKMQLGKWREALDYWLSYIGPSQRFIDCAEQAVAHGTRFFAKLQVGCSHEVASVPFVPVPGNLYQKYQAMHKLGVSGVMQCWYFGNYPGVMNRAAGELAFAPFPASRDEFLLELARRDWGPDAPQVVKAWNCFAAGYDNFPLNTIFSYYGPMANGVAWPLYLKPRDLPLEPSWQLQYPPSGDRIGECVTQSHTLEEDVTLCDRMARGWNEGTQILRALRPKYAGNPERLKDIGLAEALGIQFQSGANILKFYALREQLAWTRGEGRLGLLEQMKALVNDELALDERLLPLCAADSRLGFHSEAEGYKYYPERIRWRMGLLRQLLATEFPEIEQRLRQGLVAFPEYIGQGEVGKHYECSKIKDPIPLDGKCTEGLWARLPEQAITANPEAANKKGRQTAWRAVCDGQALHLGVICRETAAGAAPRWGGENIEIQLEPQRLWPALHFMISASGNRSYRVIGGKENLNWQTAVQRGKDFWSVQVRIPLETLGLTPAGLHPIRLNVIHQCSADGPRSWIERHPFSRAYPYTLDNSTDLGWLRFTGD